ncbi:type II secretion system F family protein [Rhizosaccharibacter radicis]|uniref:Type II secretion system F family protein n=1 Tax=Rhizosaccharibacter radicis TaxID=2782605 RepID=A0ABT1VT39_9PROT|nr:type II secretion system F family protein [Acetobacteraceae bacterium KSS12]
MASWRFTAITPAGTLVRGVTEAGSEAEAVAFIRRQGNMPMEAVPVGGGGGRLLRAGAGMELRLRRTGLKRAEVAAITRELAVMLGAGQDLDRALRFLLETAPGPRARSVLEGLRAEVRDGSTLHAALGRRPDSFPRLYVGLVRAAEAGGNLGSTLERIATLMERERALVATLQSAMIYPTLLVVAAIGSIWLLLTRVLPQFVPLFEQNGAALPRSTRVLIALGDFLGAWGLWALLLLALAGFGLWRSLRRPAVRLAADRLLLRPPVLGPLMREVLAARFTRTLGTLLGNGVPLIGAMAIVRDVIGNRAVLATLDRATDDAKAGVGLARSFERERIFPARTVHLLRLGEETAQLGAMALRAAEIHEEAVRLRSQRLVALLVPMITILMGAAVAGIVSSLLLAMLSLNDLAQ